MSLLKEFLEMREYRILTDNLFRIINKQLEIINRLTEPKRNGAARSLAVTGMTGTLINSVFFHHKNNQQHMSVSFKAAGGATATWKGLDTNGNVTNNGIDLTKPITAISNHPEFFTVAMVVDENGVATLPLQTKLSGVADGVGTVTYAATSIDGTALVLVDDVTVADVAPPVPAASLAVDYVVV